MCSLITGCFKKKIEIKDTKSFEFGYSVGNYMNGSYLYKLVLKDDNKYYAFYKADGVSEEDMLTKEIDKDKVLELENILNKHNIYKWDGYSKSDKNVLDGNGFHLYYHRTDREGISASGYMMYPKGYNDFKSDIISFYEELFKDEIKD